VGGSPGPGQALRGSIYADTLHIKTDSLGPIISRYALAGCGIREG
jgi:hypothetical protein